MASRVWLLVEWVDESDVFPSYGVVNVDTLAYEETDLYPGNLTYMRFKNENSRRAKILRLSESKRYVKKHREILERQDQQVKNVLQLCMRTIKKMKSENSLNDNKTQQQTSSHSPLPHVLVARNDNSESDRESDSDSEHNVKIERSKTRNSAKCTPRYIPQYNRKESIGKQSRGSLNANNFRRRSMISSTPHPSSSAQENIRLCFDQATQTEESFLPPPASKIEDIEAVLEDLNRRFLFLISQANVNSNGSISMPESEHNEGVLYIEPNVGDSWIDPNNTAYERHVIAAKFVEKVDAEEVVEDNGGEQQANSSIVTTEQIFKPNPNTLRVHRMSAQTTNNIDIMNDVDLVPIGNGNAKVPARLLNDIDWNSHTSATGQLLQAIFSRRVLATHSLTGKQSPAFLNRPPKKILDPQLVDDIVKTVSTKCGVPKNLVRNCITIKCTDEAKLYRNRQQYKQARKPLHPNAENVPPATPSSDESHAVWNE